MNTKRMITFALFVWGATAMTMAQSTRHIGAWSIYTVSVNGKTTVMLQTSAIEQNGETRDGSPAATLNVLCRNHKLAAIALHSTTGVDAHAVSYVQEVPTASIVASSEGSINSEKWAVTENGHTLTPYSELSQGKLNRQWLDRLNTAHAVAFQVGGSEGALNMQPSFHTEQLGEALSAVGCTN